ncbi:MAG: methyltransferase domain-containing protein [Deltaproteobacteria bacterium]|nr:methyltransferase domain-containing protein [Deltaproteobacteria bacterium]
MNEKPMAETILNSVRGFMVSRVILSGAELDLFNLLDRNPLSAEEVAKTKGANLRALTILLDALCALDILQKEAGRYQLQGSLAPVLTSSGPETVLPMILHLETLWHNWSQITNIVAGEWTPGVEKTGALAPGNRRAFIGAMHVVGAKTAPQVVAAVNPGNARRLLDVGGASGTYTLAFLAAEPRMQATLFDLPPVIEIARERIEKAGCTERVTLVPGDFNSDPLPAGHDLALLSAIIHQNSPEQNRLLYQRVFEALEPGGRIVIRDYVMSPDRTEPRSGTLFAVNMLAGTEGGNTYTFEEIKEGLTTAGFTAIRLLQVQEMSSLVEGFKP